MGSTVAPTGSALTVAGGSGDGSYGTGTRIPITAEVPSGKVFKCWEITDRGTAAKDSDFGTIENADSASTFFVTGNFYAGGTLSAVFENDQNPPVKETVYPLISGASSSWKAGSAAGLTVRADADYAGFRGVTVNGEALAEDKYTSESGSTIVTLKPDYLASLKAGSYTLRLEFADGYAETTFTTLAKTQSPKPGDGALIAAGIGAAALCAAGGAMVMRRESR